MRQNKNSVTESISFVAHHYRHGAFSARNAWRNIMPDIRPWWRTRLAAAVAAGVIVTASAAVIILHRDPAQSISTSATEQIVPATPLSEKTVRLEFADKPLGEAATEIERAYGVKLDSLPEGNPPVTLTFEGDAEELILMLNESLGSHIVIKR